MILIMILIFDVITFSFEHLFAPGHAVLDYFKIIVVSFVLWKTLVVKLQKFMFRLNLLCTYIKCFESRYYYDGW